MSTRYGGLIQTAGLVLCLDAASPRSFVSGSLVWNDLAGNGNTGVLQSATTVTYSTQGGGSVEMNGGASSFVAVGSGLSYLPFGTGLFALEAWMRPTGNGFTCIDMRADNTNGFYPNIGFDSSSRFTFFINSADRIISTAVSVSGWHHVVATRTGSATNLYVDGALQGIWPDTSDYIVNAGGMQLGRNAFIGPVYRGQMGVVRAYKGVGLTQAQVQSNFAAQRGRFGI